MQPPEHEPQAATSFGAPDLGGQAEQRDAGPKASSGGARQESGAELNPESRPSKNGTRKDGVALRKRQSHQEQTEPAQNEHEPPVMNGISNFDDLLSCTEQMGDHYPSGKKGPTLNGFDGGSPGKGRSTTKNARNSSSQQQQAKQEGLG